MRKLLFLSLLALFGCSRDLSVLAKDPNTASFHDTFSGFGFTETLDYTRSGTAGAVASASAQGTSVGQTPPPASPLSVTAIPLPK